MMEFEKLTLRQKIVRFLVGLLYGVGLGFLQGLVLDFIVGYEFLSLHSYHTFAQAIAITVAITVAWNLAEPEIILLLWFGIWLSYVLVKPFSSCVALPVISWLLFWLLFGLLLGWIGVRIGWIWLWLGMCLWWLGLLWLWLWIGLGTFSQGSLGMLVMVLWWFGIGFWNGIGIGLWIYKMIRKK